MSRNISYKRVSTTHQSCDRQLAGLGITFDIEFSDKLSGKNTNRPQLQECMSVITEGDVLWVHSIDRLARNVEDLRGIVFDLMDKGATVKFVKEGLEFTGSQDEAMKASMSKMLLTLLGAVAEFERSLITSRVREGVQQAKLKGKKIGGSNPQWKQSYTTNRAAGKHSTTKDFKPSPQKEKLIVDIKTAISYSSPKTFVELADKLNQNGVMTLSNKVWDGKSLAVFAKRNEIKL
ncbi:DNA invertase [Vibrio phage PWH3a-P1]|uniref:DNA invertase n=1 Tax=Vibrio phage PWH3a-P1 TaxID=754058 RepID=UPI0002C11CDA|nr:DNA invertase [Vibrio phage PWH3a-P1]AGH31885.1 resolvase domain-containing protein [Vibrio phage PWH3a-P1]